MAKRFVFDKQGHNLIGVRLEVEAVDADAAANYLGDNLPSEVEVTVTLLDGSTLPVTLEFFPHRLETSDMERAD